MPYIELSFLIEIEEEGLVLKEYTLTPLWVERTLNENGKYNFTIIPLGEDDDITASNESVGRTKRIVGQDSLGTFEINWNELKLIVCERKTLDFIWKTDYYINCTND